MCSQYFLYIVLYIDEIKQILYAYEDDGGEDVVASLDFWSKPPRQESTKQTSPP